MHVPTEDGMSSTPTIELSVMVSECGRGRGRDRGRGGEHGSFGGGRSSYGGRHSGFYKGSRQYKHYGKNNHIFEKY